MHLVTKDVYNNIVYPYLEEMQNALLEFYDIWTLKIIIEKFKKHVYSY